MYLRLRVEELGLEHFDKKRQVYRDLGVVLPTLEDLHHAREYHERASDKRLKKLSAENVDNSPDHTQPCCYLV